MCLSSWLCGRGVDGCATPEMREPGVLSLAFAAPPPTYSVTKTSCLFPIQKASTLPQPTVTASLWAAAVSRAACRQHGPDGSLGPTLPALPHAPSGVGKPQSRRPAFLPEASRCSPGSSQVQAWRLLGAHVGHPPGPASLQRLPDASVTGSAFFPSQHLASSLFSYLLARFPHDSSHFCFLYFLHSELFTCLLSPYVELYGIIIDTRLKQQFPLVLPSRL